MLKGSAASRAGLSWGHPAVFPVYDWGDGGAAGFLLLVLTAIIHEVDLDPGMLMAGGQHALPFLVARRDNLAHFLALIKHPTGVPVLEYARQLFDGMVVGKGVSEVM